MVVYFLGFKSISSCAQYVMLRKYFSHPSLVMYSSATQRIKLKLGQTTWTKHSDGPIRNTEEQLDHIYYTLFWRCTELLCLVPCTVTCTMMLSQNYFPESDRYRLDFLHPFLLCRITY